jgi:hypothetical protein
MVRCYQASNKIKLKDDDEMANYKNARFSNSMDGFKSWTRNFPPLSSSDVKATGYKKYDNYYLELQLVKGFLSPDSKFVSASVREYDPADADFSYVGTEKEKELLDTVFKSKVDSFTTKHNAKFYK